MSCKHCESYQHSSLMCFLKPRQPLKTKKAIHRIGRIAAKWIETRNEWMQRNPPVDGFWYCYLCGTPLTIETLTVNHVKSRSRHPELRFELDNLEACCGDCNAAKGSRDLSQVENN